MAEGYSSVQWPSTIERNSTDYSPMNMSLTNVAVQDLGPDGPDNVPPPHDNYRPSVPSPQQPLVLRPGATSTLLSDPSMPRPLTADEIMSGYNQQNPIGTQVHRNPPVVTGYYSPQPTSAHVDERVGLFPPSLPQARPLQTPVYYPEVKAMPTQYHPQSDPAFPDYQVGLGATQRSPAEVPQPSTQQPDNVVDTSRATPPTTHPAPRGIVWTIWSCLVTLVHWVVVLLKFAWYYHPLHFLFGSKPTNPFNDGPKVRNSPESKPEYLKTGSSPPPLSKTYTEDEVQSMLERQRLADSSRYPEYHPQYHLGLRQRHSTIRSPIPPARTYSEEEVKNMLEGQNNRTKEVCDSWATKCANLETSKSTSSPDTREIRVKLSEYDGKTDWPDYFCQFNAIADHNKWSDPERRLRLVSRLTGPALAIYGAHPNETYEELIQRFNDRFAPKDRATSYELALQSRKMKLSEQPEEYAQELERLANRAYPSHVDNTLLQKMIIKQYIDGLTDAEVQGHVFLKSPETLNKAVTYTRQFMCHQDRQNQKTKLPHRVSSATTNDASVSSSSPILPGSNGPPHLSSPPFTVPDPIQTMLERQQKMMETMMNQQALRNPSVPQRRRIVTCWACNQTGHGYTKCPYDPNKNYKPTAEQEQILKWAQEKIMREKAKNDTGSSPRPLSPVGTSQASYSPGNPSLMMPTYYSPQPPNYQAPGPVNPYGGYPPMVPTQAPPGPGNTTTNPTGSPPPATGDTRSGSETNLINLNSEGLRH